MTLPASAPISLSAIKTEFGAASLSDAGLAAFGRANCNMLEFLGQSNRVIINVDYSGGYIFNAIPRYDYSYWDRPSSAYVAGKTTINVNIDADIYTASLGSYAFSAHGFTYGDIVNVTIGYGSGVYGYGGSGGGGADNSSAFTQPSSGGTGISGGGAFACYSGGAQLNIVNNGVIAAGGGGGGGGCATYNSINQYGVYNVCTSQYIGGDGGSGGAGSVYNVFGGAGGLPGLGGGIFSRCGYPAEEYLPGNPGNQGTLTAGGAGVYTGGAGGNLGQSGSQGLSDPGNNSYGGYGGDGGNATLGFLFVNSYSGSGTYYGFVN